MTVPVFTPPTPIPATSPFTPPSELTNGTGVLQFPNYGPHFNQIIFYLASIEFQLQRVNYQISTTSVPGTQAAINQVAAASLNDMSDVMSSMLGNQTSIISALNNLQIAIGGLAGVAAEGVVTNQLLASSQIKKNKKEMAETDSAIKDSGRTPKDITPADFQEEAKQVIADATTISAQSKAAGFVNRTVSDTIEKTWSYTTDWVGSTAAAQAIKQFWEQDVKSKIFKPKEEVKETKVETKAQTRNTKLGL